MAGGNAREGFVRAPAALEQAAVSNNRRTSVGAPGPHLLKGTSRGGGQPSASSLLSDSIKVSCCGPDGRNTSDAPAAIGHSSPALRASPAGPQHWLLASDGIPRFRTRAGYHRPARLARAWWPGLRRTRQDRLSPVLPLQCGPRGPHLEEGLEGWLVSWWA